MINEEEEDSYSTSSLSLSRRGIGRSWSRLTACTHFVATNPNGQSKKIGRPSPFA